jgi:glucose-1-phosphate adenylyltransferase
VPFGGTYRIIDFTLSNSVNSDLRRIFVLTQYKSYSLHTHIRQGWSFLRRRELGEFLETIPPQLRSSERWYQGTGDAIFQNIYLLNEERPDRVLILSGDHIYRMDYRRMIDFHRERGADLTLACIEVPIADSERFGTIKVDEDHRVVGFREKSKAPYRHPGRSDMTLVSMGVYLFETETLVRAVIQDAKVDSQHDFGKNIIPSLLSSRRVYAYNFVDEKGKPTYWRDIGTIDSYFEANMDFIDRSPPFDLYDTDWPVFTVRQIDPPALVRKGRGKAVGEVADSIISSGCQIGGAVVRKSILSPRVIARSRSTISDSIVMSGVVVGRGSRLKKTIVDRDVVIPDGFSIGYRKTEDRKRFKISDGGVVVVPKGFRFA